MCSLTHLSQPLLHHSSSLSTSSTHRQLMALRMSKMEKYIRKHALEVTFKDALSRTERSEQVTSELEAKKLGFYLYHNVKADYDRWGGGWGVDVGWEVWGCGWAGVTWHRGADRRGGSAG